MIDQFVLEALPPNPAKFLNIPVGPTSAPIVSVFPDEFVTALLEEKVSLKVTDKISPTFLALLSDEKRPAELVLKIAPFEGFSLLNSSNEGVNGLNCLLLTSSTSTSALLPRQAYLRRNPHSHFPIPL